MKKIILFVVLTFVTSCVKNDEDVVVEKESTPACHLQLVSKTMYINPAQRREILLLAKSADDNIFEPYDWKTNIYELTVTSDNSSLISLNKEGVVTALGPKGDAEVVVTPKKGEPVRLTVSVVDKGCSVYDINKPLTADNIFLKHVETKRWIQSFEFNSKGDVYILSTKAPDPWLYIYRYTRDGTKTGEMKIAYASHGTTCSLEETPDGDYIWLPTYGTKNSNGDYKRDQLFSRVKFQNGKSLSPDDKELQENSYYMGDYDNFLPSIDFENDLIGIRYLHNDLTHVAIYRLEEVVNSPLKQITLSQSIRRGGESDGPIKEEEVIYDMSFKAHDFSDATPLYKFSFTGSEALGNSITSGKGHALQGFCIADGYAYVTYGYPRNFDGGYSAYDYNGNQVITRQLFTFLSDRDNLLEHNIAGTVFEPEGIRVKNGKMYLGAGVNFSPNIARQTVLVLPD